MTVFNYFIRVAVRCKEGLWDFFDAFNDDSLYLIDTTDMLQKYIDFEIDDLEEFAASYTYDYHDRKRCLDNKESKARMYREVLDIMSALDKRGSLDR